MRLVFIGWRIALRQSLGAVCAILASLLVLIPTIAVLLSAAPKPAPAKIAVVCPEDSSLAASLITTMMDARYQGLATLDVLDRAPSSTGYAAVLTLPEGFWDSIMTGENLSPSLVINVSSPLEGLWIRQLTESAARTLTSAQAATGGLVAAYTASGLSQEEISTRVFNANLLMMESFLNRKGLFSSQMLSSTGSIPPLAYYGSAGLSFMLFALLFLLYGPLYALRRFGVISRCRNRTFSACLLAAFSLSLPLCSLGVAVLGRGGIKSYTCLLMLSVMLTSLLAACTAVFNNPAACAAAVTGLALLQALFGGGLLPEALLPPTFGVFCRVLPLSLMRRLVAAAAFNAGFSDNAVVLFWCIALFGTAWLLWHRKGAA